MWPIMTQCEFVDNWMNMFLEVINAGSSTETQKKDSRHNIVSMKASRWKCQISISSVHLSLTCPDMCGDFSCTSHAESVCPGLRSGRHMLSSEDVSLLHCSEYEHNGWQDPRFSRSGACLNTSPSTRRQLCSVYFWQFFWSWDWSVLLLLLSCVVSTWVPVDPSELFKTLKELFKSSFKWSHFTFHTARLWRTRHPLNHDVSERNQVLQNPLIVK